MLSDVVFEVIVRVFGVMDVVWRDRVQWMWLEELYGCFLNFIVVWIERMLVEFIING